MNKQSFSSNKIILVFLGIVVFAVAGWFGYSMIFSSGDSSMTENKMMKNEGMMEENEEEGAMMGEESYGKIIAGTSAPFVEFSQAGYDKAISDGKIVFLDFYANWCPVCRAEAPEIDAGFNGLTTDQIVGFRVNFKDSDTDSDEAALAQKFNVPYQHTKVILKNGKEILRSTNQWKKSDFDTAINQALN